MDWEHWWKHRWTLTFWCSFISSCVIVVFWAYWYIVTDNIPVVNYVKIKIDMIFQEWEWIIYLPFGVSRLWDLLLSLTYIPGLVLLFIKAGKQGQWQAMFNRSIFHLLFLTVLPVFGLFIGVIVGLWFGILTGVFASIDYFVRTGLFLGLLLGLGTGLDIIVKRIRNS